MTADVYTLSSGLLPYEIPHERMCDLVLSFPVLRHATFRDRQGVWCPRTFLRWARASAYASGELHAARFILRVWNSSVRWSIGRFDAIDALATWDDSNRRAFVRWAEKPWWP